ncbi:UbiH/UbiF/VisC/COQ6 family ubiquinone biosynthesis hydroxylase [Albirhodobacter sp. R86504]|uniref:UbiH/UbiF/VisC/COQ6 family ubiquinone biosynthesis hydroxylase n=1 Tax=Albirhodobacter sp. R86504 TaxID=3093848 RepID=UPI00366B98B4
MDNRTATTILIPMTYDSDVIIVGGGLNGPSLALALAGAGVSVSLIDGRPPRARAQVAFDGRAYAIAQASKRLLDMIGIWAAVKDVCQPLEGVKAADGRPGETVAPLFLHFDSAEMHDGPLGYMLEDRHLYRVLLDAMEARPEIKLHHDLRLTQLNSDPAGVSVTLSNGEQVRGKLLIGADGRGSTVAERAGISREGWDYGQTALVAAIDHVRPHNGIAHQLFMPTGPLAVLPLKGNRSSIVWSETRANAQAISALTDDEFMSVLRPRFGDFLGEISLAGPRFSYPLSLTLARKYVVPRIALVGDAAHGVHPIAGQGLNLGLRDVGALAETVVDAVRRGEDIGAIDVLERYESWRRFDSTSLALGMDTVNKLFSNDNPILRAGRDLGMGIVQALPQLRRGFMRQASGLSGPLPRLQQGKPL